MRQVLLFVRTLAAVLFLVCIARPCVLHAGERLVTIGGPLTEVVFALGRGDSVVATDQSSTHPEAVTRLPQVGYIRSISAEGVLAQNPSLILATADLGPPPAAEQLRAGGVEVFTTPVPRDRASLFALIEAVSGRLGAEGEGAALIERIRGQLARAESIAARGGKPRVVFLLHHAGGGRAAGEGTMGDGIVALAGGDNVMRGFEGYRAVSEEAILQARPDVLLIASMAGLAGASRQELLAEVNLDSLTHLDGLRVVPLDLGYYLGFGPRTGQAAIDLARILHQPDRT